ncbi:glycosyltransferase family 2 protein [Zwartia sp.]|uniref:glycosyltransferase family 2 protein n=1 Tax=Zwartia sp. TaxID=2978004 RepID=UPI002728A3B1|nr:glycosyltransferase family 2 protein [Zwartia sp.]MDO9025284.1 glycosyltransferase family 2 protein [Zwartia sp.]
MGISIFEADRLFYSHTMQKSILDLLNEVELSLDPASRRAADSYLQLALQSQESRFEALLVKALRALRASQWARASLDLASALKIFPKHEQTQALLAKAVGACDPQNALSLIDNFLNEFPDSTLLWPLYWMHARTLRDPKHIQEALARLQEVDSGTEVLTIYQFLSSIENAPQQLGVCHFDPETLTITGWAIDRRDPQHACELRIESGSVSGRLTADNTSALLASAGVASSVGGFQIKLVKPAEYLHLSFKDGTPLLGSPLSALETLPLREGVSHAQFSTHTEETVLRQKSCVSVLVPVYGGREKTLECLHSVLAAVSHNHVVHEIIVLDDASPDAILVGELSKLAQEGRITYVRRPANLGFIRNMNRAMLLHQDRDVVWLNADTRVTGDWLDRLQNAAYSDPSIASVTPLSNNGELTSFPQMRVSSPMPTESEQRLLDQLMSRLDLPPEEVFVGCGFCFYLKRSALNDVGLLDERTLVRGYGEETEWCLRAHTRGWRHAAAVNVFIAHSGGESFGRAKRGLVSRNNAVIKLRYPSASRDFDRFVQTDSLRVAREAIQRARIKKLARKDARELMIYRTTKSALDGQSVILGFNPEQSKADRDVLGQSPMCLTWAQNGLELNVQLIVSDFCPAIVLNYHLPQAADILRRDLELFAPASYRSVDEINIPDLLAFCLKASKKSQSNKVRQQAAVTKSRQSKLSTKTLVTKQVADHLLSSNSLGLVIDDLSDPVIAQHWLSLIRDLSQDSSLALSTDMARLLVAQDTPVVAQLEKSGFVVLANFPKGLSIERWLAVFGVSHMVSCMQQESSVLTDRFDQFLSRLQEPNELEGLPRVSAQIWVKALRDHIQSSKRKPHHLPQEIA